MYIVVFRKKKLLLFWSFMMLCLCVSQFWKLLVGYLNKAVSSDNNIFHIVLKVKLGIFKQYLFQLNCQLNNMTSNQLIIFYRIRLTSFIHFMTQGCILVHFLSINISNSIWVTDRSSVFLYSMNCFSSFKINFFQYTISMIYK